MALGDRLRDYRILSGRASLTLRPSQRFTVPIVCRSRLGEPRPGRRPWCKAGNA